MKKIFIAIVSAILAAALVVVIGVGSSGFKNWNVKTWFKKSAPDTEQNNPIEDNGEGNGDPTGDYDLSFAGDEGGSVRLLAARLPRAAYAANGISEEAQLAYQITATLYPSTAENTAVDWELVWDDDGTSVTTCASLTVPSDGSLSVTLVCTEAFPNRAMKLVCTSRDSGVQGYKYIRCVGIATDMLVNGGSAVDGCRWGNTNTYEIELTNVLNYIGDDQYENLTVKSVTLHGTIIYADEVHFAGYFGSNIIDASAKGSQNWSSGGVPHELSEMYPDALTASIEEHNLVLKMIAYPNVKGRSTNIGKTVNGQAGTLFADYYSAPQNAYAEIVLKTGSLEKTVRVDFSVGVTGISLGEDITF